MHEGWDDVIMRQERLVSHRILASSQRLRTSEMKRGTSPDARPMPMPTSTRPAIRRLNEFAEAHRKAPTSSGTTFSSRVPLRPYRCASLAPVRLPTAAPARQVLTTYSANLPIACVRATVGTVRPAISGSDKDNINLILRSCIRMSKSPCTMHHISDGTQGWRQNMSNENMKPPGLIRTMPSKSGCPANPSSVAIAERGPLSTPR